MEGWHIRKPDLLSDAELAVMLFLWDAGEEVPSRAIHEALSAYGWSHANLVTMLKKIESKGYLICDRTNQRYLYRPNQAKIEYAVNTCMRIADELDLTIGDAFQYLLENKLIDANEIDKIKRAIIQK